MTDERIKEEYDVWISDVECTENERRFFSQYPAENHPTAVGFYAGFRTAERLAKIEAADRFCASCHGKEDGMCRECPDRAVILGETVKEGKTDSEKLAIAVKALEYASISIAKTDGDYDTLCVIRHALKEIQ